MQFGRVASVEDKTRKMSAVRSNFRDSASAGKKRNKFSPRR